MRKSNLESTIIVESVHRWRVGLLLEVEVGDGGFYFGFGKVEGAGCGGGGGDGVGNLGVEGRG